VLTGAYEYTLETPRVLKLDTLAGTYEYEPEIAGVLTLGEYDTLAGYDGLAMLVASAYEADAQPL